ncbi:hypothetical protein [Flavobacterium sp. I3-2]|uniref:hypothetical protein n=1 Tax=Flavobacterium sp. I3-2 TaxID=2748319 RepID=UPI0015AB4966|nr:hypothetical protein [Flavobacterium sp. I3-2]
MDGNKLIEVKLRSLDIAMKIHKVEENSSEGKISSAEILKTADEIKKWLID